ncbi:MAG: hypothetical protein ACRD9Q_05165 [Nitrososphaeraceae archaeon]
MGRFFNWWLCHGNPDKFGLMDSLDAFRFAALHEPIYFIPIGDRKDDSLADYIRDHLDDPTVLS